MLLSYDISTASSKAISPQKVSELMISASELIVKKQLQETVHSNVLLGCFYLLYML